MLYSAETFSILSRGPLTWRFQPEEKTSIALRTGRAGSRYVGHVPRVSIKQCCPAPWRGQDRPAPGPGGATWIFPKKAPPSLGFPFRRCQWDLAGSVSRLCLRGAMRPQSTAPFPTESWRCTSMGHSGLSTKYRVPCRTARFDRRRHQPSRSTPPLPAGQAPQPPPGHQEHQGQPSFRRALRRAVPDSRPAGSPGRPARTRSDGSARASRLEGTWSTVHSNLGECLGTCLGTCVCALSLSSCPSLSGRCLSVGLTAYTPPCEH